MSKKSRRQLEVSELPLTARIYQDDNYTRVEIYTNWNGQQVNLAHAEARRHPADNPDPQIGHDLALGRALAKLGKRTEKRANGLVKHADDVQDQKAQRKAEVLTWQEEQDGDLETWLRRVLGVPNYQVEVLFGEQVLGELPD